MVGTYLAMGCQAEDVLGRFGEKEGIVGLVSCSPFALDDQFSLSLSCTREKGTVSGGPRQKVLAAAWARPKRHRGHPVRASEAPVFDRAESVSIAGVARRERLEKAFPSWRSALLAATGGVSVMSRCVAETTNY
jgi:hypothetical protein